MKPIILISLAVLLAVDTDGQSAAGAGGSATGGQNQIQSQSRTQPVYPGAIGGAVGASNSVSGTGTNNAAAKMQDRAFTQEDQAVLVQIRQYLDPEIEKIGRNGAAPVHCVVRSGIVTLIGFVPTIEAGQRLETVVQGVHGVSAVENQLVIQPAVGSGLTGAPQDLPPGGGPAGESVDPGAESVPPPADATIPSPTSTAPNAGSRVYSDPGSGRSYIAPPVTISNPPVRIYGGAGLHVSTNVSGSTRP